MTYLSFHLVFIVPPLLLLAWSMRGRMHRVHPRAAAYLLAIAVIALIYTTPWDNYLVWSGVWSYGTDRVMGTIGYVPVEEYLFFVLQPFLAGLWLYRVLATRETGTAVSARDSSVRAPARAVAAAAGAPAPETAAAPLDRPSPSPSSSGRWAGALLYTAAAVLGAVLLRRPEGTYLGLILVWAAPVLALQWAFAGGEIWARRRVWATAVALPTIYLWIADALAIRLGIWRISEQYTLGPAIGSLPLEEAVFFLVTNLLVVQGLLLFLHPPGRARGISR